MASRKKLHPGTAALLILLVAFTLLIASGCKDSTPDSSTDPEESDSVIIFPDDPDDDDNYPPISPLPSNDFWWNNNWSHLIGATVNNRQNSLELSEFPVMLTLSWCEGMAEDFANLRFIADDYTTILDYWIESYTAGTEATVWVRVPSIPANGSSSIFIYFGNYAASSESNRRAYPEFEDDFSTDPNSTWNIYRFDRDHANEGVWNSKGYLELTTTAEAKGVAAFAPYSLSTNNWILTFDYYVGDGKDGGGDGMVAMFYKNESAYKDGLVYGGELYGFKDTNDNGIHGYGLEFDAYKNDNFDDPSDMHMAFIEHDVDNHLIYVDDPRVDDST